MSEHPWFSPRGYQHLDAAIGRVAAEAIATSPTNVIRHSFLPFIGYEKKTRRYSSRNGKSVKVRPIMYAAHSDSAIYTYYSFLLEQRYEEWLRINGIAENVIAYRRLGRSNVDFAKEAFAEVERRGVATALCFDIESFFPTLDHLILKGAVEAILDAPRLPDDWFAVVKSLTKYAWIDRQDIVRVRGEKLASAREGRAISIPQLHELRANGLIRKNPSAAGIPQGSPISAILANIYMSRFDVRVAGACRDRGAFYRRYSDDILIICEAGDNHFFRSFVERELAINLLRANEAKFEQSTFRLTRNGQTCDRPLQYLGIVYDGACTRIRPSSISRFYRRMAKAVRRIARKAAASIHAGKTERLHRRRLYAKFSPLGAHNFVSGYAEMAATKLQSADVARQTSRASRILRRRIAEMEDKLGLPKT